MPICVHVEPVEAAMPVVIACAALDEDRAVILRHCHANLVPVRIEKAAQDNINLSRSQSRDDSLDVPCDPSGVATPQQVIVPALKDDDSHAVRNITIESSQHRLEGVSADPRVPDLNIVPGGSQQAFQLSRECLVTPNPEASRVAVAKGNDPDWLRQALRSKKQHARQHDPG